MRCGRQDHVMRLDARKLFEDRARRISKACAALPHLEAFPQHKGKKADEDMGLNAVLVLMPDRTDVELIFLDAESGLGLGDLDIGLPELLIAPIVDVRAQQIGVSCCGRLACAILGISFAFQAACSIGAKAQEAGAGSPTSGACSSNGAAFDDALSKPHWNGWASISLNTAFNRRTWRDWQKATCPA